MSELTPKVSAIWEVEERLAGKMASAVSVQINKQANMRSHIKFEVSEFGKLKGRIKRILTLKNRRNMLHALLFEGTETHRLATSASSGASGIIGDDRCASAELARVRTRRTLNTC